jgi:hypothetical protein
VLLSGDGVEATRRVAGTITTTEWIAGIPDRKIEVTGIPLSLMNR